MGIFFTIGSYLFLRAVHPRDKTLPLFPSLFATDELYGAFCFFIGILICVPMTAMYAAYEPSTYYRGAVVISCFFTVVMVFVLLVHRRDANENLHRHAKEEIEKKSAEEKPATSYFQCLNSDCDKDKTMEEQEKRAEKGYFVPLFECIFGGESDHYKNDLLILSWLALIGNIMAVVMCIGMLIHAVESGRGRDIFDYATGLGDMVLFLIGSIYFTSGFYPDQIEQSERLQKAFTELRGSSVELTPASRGSYTSVAV